MSGCVADVDEIYIQGQSSKSREHSSLVVVPVQKSMRILVLQAERENVSIITSEYAKLKCGGTAVPADRNEL
jgi:hypothetical protein